MNTKRLQGRALTKRREALGLSRTELAAFVGVSERTIYRYENEEVLPLTHLLRSLDITLKRLEEKA